MWQGHVAVVAGAWRRRRSLRALLLPLYSSDRERANSSGTTFYLAIRWKTTFFDKIAQMRHMERPK
jgi:hypothetical protein